MNSSIPSTPLGFGSHWLARTGMADHGDIVTFYSYKGGTGRSMALVNCAGLIAQRLPIGAKPILLIDFDLEAPGLHRYLAPFLPPSEINSPRPGLLELFDALRMEIDLRASDSAKVESGEAHRLDDQATARIVDEFDLGRFIVSTTVPGMHVIMAGQFDEDYGQRLARFNWESLFAKSPALFRCLAERLAREYSFTFVDSRTGLSDTSGICTMLLPNVLVVVFTPNNQSLTGIEHLVRKAVDYRSSASDSRELRVYPLPSRVDNQVEHFRHVWRMGDSQHPLFGRVKGYQPLFQEMLQSALGMAGAETSVRLSEYFDVVQVPHNADYSYGERLCFASSTPGDSLSIRGSYEQFLPWLATGAQPWERPSETLLNLQALRWLRDLGVDVIPENNDSWRAWFDRLLGALSDSEHPVLCQQTLLSPDLRFDTSFVLALAYAYRGDLRASSEYLKKTMSSHSEDVSSNIPSSTPMQLLSQWSESLTLTDLRTPERKSWIEELEQLVSHWQPLRNQRRIWLEAVVRLADKAGWHDMGQRAGQQLVSLNRETLGDEHLGTLTAMSNLAGTLQGQGDLPGARALEEQVLAVRRRVQGDEHPETLTAMSNLAGTLQDQGDLAGARAFEEQVLAVTLRVQGKEHPDSLIAMGNLAGTLQAQGDLPGARVLQEQVLAVSRRVLGDEHPDTLTSMNNLASTLQDQGDLAEAQALEEQVLAVRRRILGEEHLDTMTSMNNLASTLKAQGDMHTAQTLQEQVLAMSRRILGTEHPRTLTTMNNLANTLQALGDLAGARVLEEQTFAVRRRVLGEEHPDTLTSIGTLASTLQAQGDLRTARELYQRSWNGFRRILGENNRATWVYGMELAAIDVELGDAPHAALVLDGFTSPSLTTSHVHWLGLRLKVAEQLGVKEDIARFQNRLRETLRKE